MNKSDLVENLSSSFGMTKAEAGRVLEFVITSIHDTVKDGKEATLSGLGIFTSVQRKARTGRNPRTGETVAIAAKRVPKFRPAKAFKEAVS